MPERVSYDTNLAMGLGLIPETRRLLEIWRPSVTPAQLHQEILSSGALSNLSAYRLRNIVVRCFGDRYLTNADKPALYLKKLMSTLSSSEFSQLLFLYTCRANPVLADFIRDVYWDTYSGGARELARERATEFVRRAVDDGMTPSRWAEGQIERMGRYLTGACADFGLLGARTSSGRRLSSFRIEKTVVAYLAYELHNSGLGDNAVLSDNDWRLFGLARSDVLDELKRVSYAGWFVVQAAADVVRIGWKYPDMEAVCDVLAQG